MYVTRTRIVLIAAAAAALTIAGCSDEPATNTEQTNSPASATTAARSDFNDADVTFLQMMYPHHAQAVEMAELAPQRTENQELLSLADAINQAQGPEMQQMTSLLQGFGKPAPTEGEHDADSGHSEGDQEGHGGHNGHEEDGGHEGHSSGMPGMMSPESMDALDEANGEAFDRMWLEMMIEHHQGAIDMAQTEIADGSNAEAKAMAEAITTTQQTEIDQMNGMLGR